MDERQTLEPVNAICPKCGNPNYMRHIPWAKGELRFKCLNCLRYFTFKDLHP